jgi:CheY-like chemotaxis protein
MERNNRILIVDDQEDLREQLAKLLISSGQPNKTTKLVQSMRARLMGLTQEQQEETKPAPKYDIDTAGQGEEAYEMVKAALENGAPYAVMFTDMRMPPGWDGLKTAKKIREIDKDIEIVIMTAYADHDQAEISDAIGTPEKLLYIKKPFQTEEIFQLALSLTAKWNFEELQRTRREWLENLIKSMRRLKMACEVQELYNATLESLLSFTESDKGFIAIWNDATKKWMLKSNREINENEANSYLEEHSQHLQESDTIQKNFNDTYLVPLKSNDLSAVVVIYNAKTHNDAEWYKLINLLVMTSNENLENIAFKEKKAADDTSTQNLINIVRDIRDEAQELKGKYEKEKHFGSILEKIDKLLENFKRR